MQVKLKERSLQSGGPLHETCAAYIDLLGQLEKQSYAVQAAAFWLVEYVYNRVRSWPGLQQRPCPPHSSRGCTSLTQGEFVPRGSLICHARLRLWRIHRSLDPGVQRALSFSPLPLQRW